MDCLARIRQGEKISELETVRKRKDGHQVDVAITLSPIVGSSGEITGVVSITRDISGRKRAEQALAEERELLRALMENNPDHIYFKDIQSRFIRINPALAHSWGLTDPLQANGKTDFDFFTADHAQQAYDDEQRVIRTGQAITAKEERETWAGGGVTWVLTTKVPLRSPAGEIIGTFGISRDITERKLAEDRLRKLSTAVEQSPASVVITDVRGEIEYVNRRFTQLTGYLPDEVLGRNPRILKSGGQAPGVYRDLWATILSGAEWHGEFANKKKNGEIYWESASIVPIRDSGGAITHFLAVKEDITERKRSEQAIRDSEHFLQSTLDALSSHIAILDEEGRIVAVNVAWRRFAVANGGNLEVCGVGRNYLEVCRKASANTTDADSAAEGVRQTIAGTLDDFSFEYPCHSTEQKRWFVMRVTRFAEGGPRGVVLAHENITNRKLAEEALRKSEKHYRVLFERNLAGVFRYTAEGMLLEANEAFAHILGYSSHTELAGLSPAGPLL